MEVALRPADYRLTVLTENPAGIDQLSVKLNKVRLPAFAAAPGGNATLFQTSIPRSAFTSDARQTLEFSRQTSPISIHEIRLLDPTYTVLSYLNEAGANDKPIAYRFGWWTRPNALLCLCGAGSGGPDRRRLADCAEPPHRRRVSAVRIALRRSTISTGSKAENPTPSRNRRK